MIEKNKLVMVFSDAFNIHFRKFKSNPLLSLPFYCHLVQNAKGEVT